MIHDDWECVSVQVETGFWNRPHEREALELCDGIAVHWCLQYVVAVGTTLVRTSLKYCQDSSNPAATRICANLGSYGRVRVAQDRRGREEVACSKGFDLKRAPQKHAILVKVSEGDEQCLQNSCRTSKNSWVLAKSDKAEHARCWLRSKVLHQHTLAGLSCTPQALHYQGGQG